MDGWRTVWLLILGAAGLSLGPVLGAERLPGEYLHEIKVGEYETPHTAWAKPYARGKVKVFFLTPFTAAAREVTELWQRMDMEVYGETTMETTKLGREDGCFPDVKDTREEEKTARLREKLQQRYDVIVWANFLFSALNKELQYRVLEQVSQGTGLVFVYPHQAPPEVFKHPTEEGRVELIRGIPFAGLPFFTTTFSAKLNLASPAEIPRRVVSTYTFHRGRVAQVDYGLTHNIRPCGGGPGLTPAEPFTFETPTYYDYYQALIIRTILWAADRQPRVQFVALPEDGGTVDYDALPHQTFALRLRNEWPQNLAGELWLRVRDVWGEEEFAQKRTLVLQPGDNSLSFSLPALKGGGHFVDLLLTSQRGRENWASFFLQVKPPMAVAAIKLARRSFPRMGSARGEVRFDGAVPARGYSLQMQLLDNYQRLFAQREYPLSAGAESVEFAVPLRQAVSLCGRARARIVRGKAIVHQAEKTFIVQQRLRHEYPAVIWGRMPGILGHYAQQRLRQAGFCAVLSSPNATTADQLALDDLRLVPYCTRVGASGSFTDEKVRRDLAQRMRQIASELRDYSPLVYSLGDECYIPTDFGFKPADQPAFRDYLRQKYGHLDALNAAWGTALTSWEEAETISLSEAKQQGRFVQYHDTQSFREARYAEMFHFLASQIRRVAPGAPVGAEGSQPGDLEQTIRRLEFWGPYRRLHYNTLLRSLAPRDLMRGNWFGGYRSQRRDPLTLPTFLWEALLDGNNLIQYFAVNTVEGIFNTDFSWAYWTEWFWDSFQEVLDGIGQLLAASEYDYDGLALHHSQACWHASALDSRLTNIAADNDGWLWLLTDLGVQHYYLPRSAIEAGRLRTGQVKVLLLPYSQALSQAEAEEIRAFVQQGGMLIADLRPGVMGGDCQPLEVGYLDDLFGIRRLNLPASTAPPPAEAVISGDYSLGTRTAVPSLRIPQVVADGQVVTAGGHERGAANGVPVVIAHRQGRGLAVLLNFSLADYAHARQSGDPVPFQKLLRALLFAAGVTPQAQVVADGGNALPRCRFVRFRRGKAIILGLFPYFSTADAPPVAAHLRLQRPGWIYDLRARRSLGRKTSVPIRLRPGQANLYALLPYRVEGVRLGVPSQVPAGSRPTVAFALTTPPKVEVEGHVLRLKVFGPDGQERKFYAQTLYPTGSRGETAIPFACNDMPGRWTVRLRDVLTGWETSRELQVVPQTAGQ